MILDMTNIQPLVDQGLLNVSQGDGVSILNYSKDAQYSKAWTPEVLMCRGLIIDSGTKEILALPLAKFFNLDEIELPPDFYPEEITEKLDGSLGISYYHPRTGQLLWATRGSFVSVQAQVAQKMWDARYSHVCIPPEWTVMVEIIHPDTTQVVSYDFEDLVVLAIRNRLTGEDLPYTRVCNWAVQNGLRVASRVFGGLDSLREIVKTMKGSEGEGFVLRCGDFRVKLKAENYVLMHQMMSGLNAKGIADLWYQGDPGILVGVEEEYRNKVESQMQELDRMALELKATLLQEFDKHKHVADRKSFVFSVGTSHPHFYILMALYQNQAVDYKALYYKTLYGHKPRKVSLNEFGRLNFEKIP